MLTPAEKCLAAYDHVMKILEINNDNYFKRTQILMIVAQSVLFLSFLKILTLKKDTPNLLVLMKPSIAVILLFVITLLGSLSAIVWVHFIRRQSNVLNLCKTYLKCIENSLMQFHVPSGYWTYEGMMSHPESYEAPELVMPFKVDTNLFPFPLKPRDSEQSDNKPFQSRRCFQFPRKEDKNFRIGLFGIEKSIAWFLFFLWTAILLGMSGFVTYSNLSKELDMSNTTLFLLIYAAVPTIALAFLAGASVWLYASWLKRTKKSLSLNDEVLERLSKIEQQFREHFKTAKQDDEAQVTKEADTPQKMNAP